MDSTYTIAAHPSRRYYRPELDVLRFGAFLLVLIKHSWPDTKGSGLFAEVFSSIKHAGAFGVPLFFLLSSFLITELLMRERAVTGRIHVQAFYLRRILRIWPLSLAPSLQLSCMAEIIIPTGFRGLNWGPTYFLSGNWWAVFNTFYPVSPLLCGASPSRSSSTFFGRLCYVLPIGQPSCGLLLSSG